MTSATQKMTLEALFQEAASQESDISGHLEFLRNIAQGLQHVTEFGVRSGMSTRALVAGGPTTMVSYDINPFSEAAHVGAVAAWAGNSWKFVQADTLKIDIEPTDLLFIDTLHTYEQLVRELFLHSPQVRQYIAIHDTVLFAHHGEDGRQFGVIDAICDFLKIHTQWVLAYASEDSCGLQVYRRMK